MRRFALLNRFLQFRNELVGLWRAFMAPGTPWHLKALMLLVPLYLVSPIDLIPDFIPFAGWLDDLVIVPLLVNWIFGLLSRYQQQQPPQQQPNDKPRRDQTIDGTYRRR
jgi:uncharacterized membrane protein YkvA (DUF1232 family)